MITEVAPNRWEQFCERVQEACQGAMVGLRFAPPESVPDTIAHDVLLLKIDLDDKTDPCNNNLVIETGLPNERPSRHVVVEPIHILLKIDGGGDRFNHLEILAENGTWTLVFHPGLHPELVKGLELRYCPTTR